MKLHRFVVYCVQLVLCYFPARLLAICLCKERRISFVATDLQPDRSYVVALNHVSRLDPFIACGSLPFNVAIRLFPYRFFVANAYYEAPILRQLLWLVGGFRAYPKSGKKYGLAYAETLLNDRQTVFIFPEGKVRRETKDITPKRGIAELAKIKNTLVIPVHIKKHGRRRRFSVFFGTPGMYAGQSALEIMQIIRKLA